MDGRELVKFLDVELKRRGIPKGEFYAAIGITATAYYGWRNGAVPKAETVEAIEKYLDLDLSTIEKSDMNDETAVLLQSIRERQDLRVLLSSAKDVPPSSIYELIAQLERQKEMGQN